MIATGEHEDRTGAKFGGGRIRASTPHRLPMPGQANTFSTSSLGTRGREHQAERG